MLSRDVLRSIFHVDSQEQVPEYEVVRIHSRIRRSTDGENERTVYLRAFNGTRVLRLRPNKHLARKVPVYYAEHDPGRGEVVVTPASDSSEDIGEPYQDKDTMSAIMVRKDPHTGAILMDGTVGEDLVVRSLPRSVLDVLKTQSPAASVLSEQSWQREDEQDLNAIRPPDDEAFMDGQQESLQSGDLLFSDGFPLVADDNTKSGQHTETRQPYLGGKEGKKMRTSLPEGLELLRRRRNVNDEAVHIVFKRSLPELDKDYGFMEADHIPARNPEARSRSKREAPAVIYPEILVLVDYDGYLLHGQDNTKIKSYYVSFWNGADLRYKLLREPKVKISIAGIIISRSRDAMPYLERNRVGRDAIDSASALTDMGKYLFLERRLPTYDIAVAITKYDLCRRRKSGRCTTGTAGTSVFGRYLWHVQRFLFLLLFANTAWVFQHL